jgi:hypothetical protein
MKADFLNTAKMILADRLMTVLLIVFIVACGAFSAYVLLSLRPSDLQVAVHYTSYGETTFYRDKWYYLISFVVFGVVVAIMHTILTAKLYTQGRRQMAFLFLGLSFAVLFVAWSIAWSILRVAFL